MKKQLLSLVILVSIALSAISQSTAKSKVILPDATYEDMKANGKLNSNIDYVVIKAHNADVSVTDSHVTKEHLDKMKYKAMGGGATLCNCLVPLDPNFSIAEFTNGTAPDYRNDDGSTPQKTIPFNFCLYGTQYNQLYINNNGNISFGAPYTTFSANAFPDPTYVMVAPFWGDVDTRNTTSGLVYYKIMPTYMIVKWVNVGYYANHVDKINNFQLIITDGTDPILPAGNNIAFCYGNMDWTTGDASQGVNGFGGIPATVGVNKGDGVNFAQISQFDQAGNTFAGPNGPSGVSWLDNKSFYFNSCSSTNIAPIVSGLNNCDTLKICGSNDTLIFNGLFLSPEAGQTTTITVNLNGTQGATILSNNSGNSASAQVMIIASAANAGNNTITFIATDNGVPAGTSIVNLNIFVDTTGLSNFNPQVSGNLDFCQGNSTTLNVTPTNFDSYIWNNGSTATSLNVTTGGQYWVTSTQNGCSKTSLVNVVENPLPTPVITGPLFTCGGGSTTLSIDSTSLYTSYNWSNTSPPANTNPTITVNSGTYAVTVVDANGCIGTSPPVTITNANPQVSITGNAPFCPGSTLLLTAVPTLPSGANYLWSNQATTQSVNVNSATTYTVQVSYNNNCNTSTTVTTSQFASPNASFTETPPSSAAPGAVITFNNTSTVAGGTITNVVWNFGDSTTVYHTGNSPTHSYTQNGIYTVMLAVQSSDGCWDTTRVNYSIISDIEEPNVFTPNGDGKNDVLSFKNLEFFPNTVIRIYNRWGKKIYETDDYHNDWNGGSHPEGVYYYILSNSKFQDERTGFVQLLR